MTPIDRLQSGILDRGPDAFRRLGLIAMALGLVGGVVLSLEIRNAAGFALAAPYFLLAALSILLALALERRSLWTLPIVWLMAGGLILRIVASFPASFAALDLSAPLRAAGYALGAAGIATAVFAAFMAYRLARTGALRGVRA